MSFAGEAVVSIWHDIAPEGRDVFYDWHVHEHMPERVGIPGFLRGRRYIAERGAPEFFTLYEALTIETLAGQDYLGRLNSPTPWTLSAVTHFRDVHRATQRVLHSGGPGMGGHLLTVRLEADDPASFRDRVNRTILAPLASAPGLTGAHLCQTDVGISTVPTREKAERDGATSVPGWTLMVEAAAAYIIERAEREVVTAAALREAGARDEGVSGLYRLEYVRTKTATS